MRQNPSSKNEAQAVAFKFIVVAYLQQKIKDRASNRKSKRHFDDCDRGCTSKTHSRIKESNRVRHGHANDVLVHDNSKRGIRNKIYAHGLQPGYLAPGATCHCSNVPPVLAHLLPLRLVTPRATPDRSKRATCAPGAAVSRGWREVDDRKRQGCLQTLVKMAHRPL